jgi:membrane-associated protease RseP (regulator of RpoE activity)
MTYLLGVLVLLVGVSVSIGLHELGHMLTAKRFGVRVSQYMVGFGPTVWSRKRGETEYGVKAFPLGGYVRLIGMIPPADEVKPIHGRGWASRLIEDTRAAATEEIEPGEEHRAFYRLAWWKRVIVMATGPVTNLALAVVIFTGIGVFYGAPTAIPTVASIQECVLPAGVDRDCAVTDPATAAALSDLRAGDQIVSADGATVTEWEPLRDYIRDHAGVPLELGVIRDGAEMTISLTPTVADRIVVDDQGSIIYDANGDPLTVQVGYIGVQPRQVIVRQGVFFGATQVGSYLNVTAHSLVHTPSLVYHSARVALGMEERDPNGLLSIVGVGRIAGEIGAADLEGYSMGARAADWLGLVAMLNLALFIFNMIPLLPLDGGHVAGGVWQGVKNGWVRSKNRSVVGAPLRARPVDLARMMPATYVMFVLLIGLGILLMYVDVVAPISLG